MSHYVKISATSPAGVGPWKLDGGTKWQVSTTGSCGCSCELCQGAAHLSPFLRAQVELGWPPLLALRREQPVSDDHRVSVPSHPDLGASVLHWEQGAEEGVLGRRGWFGREDGVGPGTLYSPVTFCGSWVALTVHCGGLGL